MARYDTHDAGRYTFEKRRVFARNWCALTFCELIPNPGDALPVELAGMPLLVVENTQSLEVIAQVPETDIQRFAVGDTVDIEIGALGDAATRGVVTQINPSGHYASRQYRVQVAVLGGARDDVKSGMYARVVLRKGARSVIAVPQEALIQRGQLTGLLTVDPQNRALLRWVRTGKQYGDRVEILSGLAEGERYVAAHEGRLADGQYVTIQN